MFDFQSQAIFPTHAVGRPGPLSPAAERLQLETGGGEQLHGVHIPPSSRAKSGVLVLGFAGNAWNSQDAATYLHELFPEADVVAFHYRGYTPSTGKPSAEALIADAPLVYDLAVGRVKPKRTIAVGFSIGSGVAARLASSRPVDGTILVTPFDSLKSAAADLYPMLPVRMLFRHDIDAAEALARHDVPTAIIAAADDQLILSRRTDALRGKVRNLVFDRTIPRAGHNYIYQRSDFQRAMRDALAKVVSHAEDAPR